jgi:hypothetical protein
MTTQPQPTGWGLLRGRNGWRLWLQFPSGWREVNLLVVTKAELKWFVRQNFPGLPKLQPPSDD